MESEENQEHAAGDCSQFNIMGRDGGYSGRIHVAPLFYGMVIGKKGSTCRSIQADTQTKITIPNRKAVTDIIVTGESRDSVARALARIEALVSDGRRNTSATHFFSVATNAEGIQNRFVEFKSQVLATTDGDQQLYPDELFQKPHKLHLTLFALTLVEQAEIDRVNAEFVVFRRENSQLFEKPFELHMKGLGFWGRNSGKARVLYGKVTETADHDRLQDLANQLQQFLIARRVIPSDRYSINLHMTVMNVSYLLDSPNCDRRKTFDCAPLLERFADWDFGTALVPELDLCRISSATERNYYTRVSTVAFGADGGPPQQRD